MEVRIENVPPRRVLALRHVGPYPGIGEKFGRLFELLGQHGVNSTGEPLGIFHDDPRSTPEDQLRSDACATVAPDQEAPTDELHVIDLPGGKYAVATYLGPYSGLAEAWTEYTHEWFPQSGYEYDSSRPCYEMYMNDCNEVPPEEVRTDMFEAVK